MKRFVAIGVDCDPDRVRGGHFNGGLNLIETLLNRDGMESVSLTLNVRSDLDMPFDLGCYAMWDRLRGKGHEIAWHLHYYNDGKMDVSESNIRKNIEHGFMMFPEEFRPKTVHMGWTFQNDYSLKLLSNLGIINDYSPLPGMKYGEEYDWSDMPMCVVKRCGVRLIPAYTFNGGWLNRRHGTNRVMLTLATEPRLYRKLIRSWVDSQQDYLVTYFHADEIGSLVGGWRKHLYSADNIVENVGTLRELGVTFVTVRELGSLVAN